MRPASSAAPNEIEKRLKARGGGLVEHVFLLLLNVETGRLLNRPALQIGLSRQVDQDLQMLAGRVEQLVEPFRDRLAE